jgi:hypothetical protein
MVRDRTPSPKEAELTEKRKPLWRRLLDGWTVIAARFGAVQTLLILALFYLALIGPVSLVQAVARRDQLDKRTLWKDGSAWRETESAGTDLERAKLLS